MGGSPCNNASGHRCINSDRSAFGAFLTAEGPFEERCIGLLEGRPSARWHYVMREDNQRYIRRPTAGKMRRTGCGAGRSRPPRRRREKRMNVTGAVGRELRALEREERYGATATFVIAGRSH